MVADPPPRLPAPVAQSAPATRLVAVHQSITVGVNGDAPSAPADPPTLWAALAWVRRQFVGAFFNQAPLAHPLQTSVTTGGVVHGALGAGDPDGDPLQMDVDQQPANGQVVINADGGYTYVPTDPDFVGTDTFVVTIRDEGVRWFSKPGVTSVTVSVRVGEQPVTTAPEVDAPDSVTGSVSGSLGVSDPNSDVTALTYSMVDQPRYGTVVFDSASGGFVYTPSPVGRLGAAGLPGLTDSFSVAVSNGISPAVVVAVAQVPVVPGTVTVTESPVDADSQPFGLVVTKDGSRAFLANNGDRTVIVIDLRSGAVGAPISVGAKPLSLAVSGDGKRLFVLGDDDTLTVVDTDKAAVVGDPIAVGNDATAVALSPDGRRAYVSNSGDGTVSMIDTTTGTVMSTISVGSDPMGLAVSPDGRYVYVANSGAGSISVIDVRRAAVVTTAAVGASPIAVLLSGDGSRLYVADAGSTDANADGTVSVLDATTLQAIGAPIAVGDYPSGLALSADGFQLYVANALSDQVSVIDTETHHVASIAVGSAPTGVAAVSSAAGSFLLVTHAAVDNTSTGGVSTISLDGSQPLALIPAPVRAVASQVVSSATTVTPTRSSDFTQGFNVTNLTGRPIVLLSQRFVWGAVFPTDGRASGPLNGTILQPGASQHFELTRYVIGDNVGTLTYYQPAADGKEARTYEVVFSANQRYNSRCEGSSGACAIDGDGVTFYDDANSSYTISADNSDAQVAAINSLCGSSKASCRFVTNQTAPTETFTPEHPVGAIVRNSTESNITKSVAIVETTSTTTNLKVAAKAGFEVMKVIKAELSAEYGKAWTDTHQFGETINMTVPPGKQGWIVGQEPVKRYYGDMIITVGNTTITVKDMYVDTPDPSRAAIFTPTTADLGTPI
ncbi:hypothetical protein B1R94_26480 [Mycolicibacterium litorale]|nr:hypothetical protein B1R94_26480 [Mycolicibacterium litorale]